MSGIFKKISTAVSMNTTYRVGFLQAKAYRALKQHTARALKDLEVSTTEWAFLGMLFDNKDGLRAAEAAEELGVEAPFVTVLISKFKKRNLLETSTDKNDNRAKMVNLTQAGREFVVSTEKMLREKTSSIIKGIPRSDILTYLTVLDGIIKNANKEY